VAQMKQTLTTNENSVQSVKKLSKIQQQAVNEQLKATEEKYVMIKEMNFALEKRILELQARPNELNT
jgi:hypothetical protein